jgi:TRAP-type mannitol/chloroaromatic compound transport system permease small subunit
MLVLLVTSLPYVGQSWALGESSRDAGGLAALYLLKTVIPVFAVMLILQGLVVIGRSALTLWTHKGGEPPPPEPPGF